MTSKDQLESNKAVVREWFAALSEQRYEDAWSKMDDDGDYWVLRQRTTMPITDFAPVLLGHLERTFTDGITFTPDVFTAEDDRVAVTVDAEATLKNGDTFDNLYNFVFTLRDGRILHVREYGDTYRSFLAFGGVDANKKGES